MYKSLHIPLILCLLTRAVANEVSDSKSIQMLRESNALMIQKLFDLQAELQRIQTDLSQKESHKEIETIANSLQVKASIRHRMEMRDFSSGAFAQVAEEDFFTQRARLGLTYQVRDEATVHMRILDARNWGSNRGIIRTGNDEFTGIELLYLKHEDWISDAEVILGRQTLHLGDGLILGADEWDAKIATFDGIRVNKRRGRAGESVDFFYTKVSAGPLSNRNPQDDIDLGGIYANFKPSPQSRWGAYAIGRRDALIDQTLYQMGAEGEYTRNRLLGRLHLAMQQGAQGALDMSGSMIRAEAEYDTRSTKKHAISLGYYMASGDDSPLDTKNSRWDPMYGTRHHRFTLADHFNLSNLEVLRIAMNFQPQRDTRMSLSVADLNLESSMDMIQNSYGVVTANRGSGATDLGQEWGVTWEQDHRADHRWFGGLSYLSNGEASGRFLNGLSGAKYLYAGSEFVF